MTGSPPQDPGHRGHVLCPRCDVEIPADLEVCPFCRKAVAAPPEERPHDIRKLLVVPERFPRLKEFVREYGRWLKATATIAAVAAVLWALFIVVTRLTVTVPDDPTFSIRVEQEKKSGRTVLLKGELTNNGESVPDLSLRSIGVTAEFRMNDGRVERKRVFPKSPFRGEGALFHGESGTFEIEVPLGAKAVTLRAEVVHLGAGSPFGITGTPSRHPARRKRR
jgi:hypothetical protein